MKAFTLDQMGSMNVRATRPAIGDQEFAWVENFIQLGAGNLRAIPGKGDNLYTATGGNTVVEFMPFNIGSTSYVAVFLSDGTGYSVRMSDGAVTTMSAVANTFYTAGVSPPDTAQWGGTYLLIVGSASPNSYWVWDGTSLFGAGTLSPVVTITSGGTGYASAPTVSASGGSGSGSSFNATVSGGSVVSIAVTNPGSGYVVGDIITLGFAGGGGAGAAATMLIMPFGLSGSAIETYQSRVWIANGPVVTFSAPASFDNFATSSGGGSFTSTDSFLRVQFTQLIQSNGFLYPFGDSSINVISNVQTSGSPTTTTFNNNNTDPQVGTPWHESVQAFGRAIVFGNNIGVYGLYGGAAEKVSDKVDGIFTAVSQTVTGLDIPSGAVADIFAMKVYLLLVDVVDPFDGSSRKVMLGWTGKEWFIATQEVDVLHMATHEINSVLTAWGTDGTNIFPMFQNASASLTKKLLTKLWAGDGYIAIKQAMRIYQQIRDNSGEGFQVTIGIDTDEQSSSFSFDGSALIVFTNNSGGIIQFQNNSAQNINFTVSGAAINGGDAQAYGKLLGLSLTSTSKDFTILNLALGYRDYTAFA